MANNFSAQTIRHCDNFVSSAGNALDHLVAAAFSGFSDIHSGWKELDTLDQNKVVRDVRNDLERIAVRKEHGGENERGVSKGVFDENWRVIARMVRFGVSQDIASMANRDQLRRAEDKVLTKFKDAKGDREHKFVKALKEVKSEDAAKKPACNNKDNAPDKNGPTGGLSSIFRLTTGKDFKGSPTEFAEAWAGIMERFLDNKVNAGLNRKSKHAKKIEEIKTILKSMRVKIANQASTEAA